MLRYICIAVSLIGLLCLQPAPVAQVQHHTPRPPADDPSATPDGQTQGWPNQRPPDPSVVDAQKRAQKELGKQRYKDIQKDSEQLLALATQLKQQVDTAGEHTMSLDVIKKAEQIEKLAKDVKNKMKG